MPDTADRAGTSNSLHTFWGDIHNHCGITYAFGSLEHALSIARRHLDFSAVTAHATWHDMPRRTEGNEFLVDYHTKGFAALAGNWDGIRQVIEAANLPHQHVTFHGYEAHSTRFGDHHLLSPCADLPIVEASSPRELVEKLAPRPVIAIPHHIAYAPAGRSNDWEAFSAEISPVVEVFSKHGCSMSDQSPYPYLLTLGPRDSRTTIRAGLRRGHRFGFTASTDDHGGYPGTYGDGLMAVLAGEKTRESIWEAILARRTYAVSGDRIACRFRVNGAELGNEVQDSGPRQVSLKVVACDRLDRIVIYKNSEPWQTLCGGALQQPGRAHRFKLRIEMGWGMAGPGFLWNGELAVRDGTIASVDCCFRGESAMEFCAGMLAPTPDHFHRSDFNGQDNAIIARTPTDLSWRCTTFTNLTSLQPQTSALIVEVEGDAHTTLALRLNEAQVSLSVGDLLGGSRAFHLQDFRSKAFMLHRAVPATEYCWKGEWSDHERLSACDSYDVEIRQANGQYAWISPIYLLS